MISDKKTKTMVMTKTTAAVSRLDDTWVFLFHKSIIMLEVLKSCTKAPSLHRQERLLLIGDARIIESLVNRLNAHAKLGDFAHCK
jgi:hypothetical protein